MASIVITLPDGSLLNYENKTTPLQVANDIGEKLASQAVAAKVNDKLVDLTTTITSDASVTIITPQTPEGLEVLRHSTAHVLAQAVKEIWPKAQITIGPVIENGFYYDIDFPETISPEDLPKIEEKMKDIASRKLEVSRKELTRKEAIAFFKGQAENFKAEIIEDLPEESVSLYAQGDFTDLCRGPHIPNTDRIGKFKLLSLAGAYWRGNENNPMLTRIYGTAWPSKKELDTYLRQIEEAKKRDHRKLGPELGLFAFLPVAPSMPFYMPKGARLFRLLTDFMRKEIEKDGYEEVICPQLMTSALWERSGHLEHFDQDMFSIREGEDITLCLKPMNCPGHVSLFGSTRHSYRELPVRYSEFTRLHRNERVGVTHGLFRTRAFSQDDGHIFCTPEQIGSESLSLINFTFRVYKTFGFDKISIKLATRPSKFLGTVENWDKATQALEDSLTEAGLEFDIARGEGAFYGPKIEFHIEDCLGRSWQCGTVQVDFSMPERFELEYIDSHSQAQRPVMIHRAILGSLERFMGILIEHHGGHLPMWIAPTQVIILNVTDNQEEYAKEVAFKLQSWGTRVELDLRNEKLGYKIRQAQLQKIPLMLILGDKEKESQTLSARQSSGKTLNDLSLEEFRKYLEPQLKPQEV